jgi:hypothetical protein
MEKANSHCRRCAGILELYRIDIQVAWINKEFSLEFSLSFA